MIFDADYIWLYIYHNLSISLGTRMYRMSKRTWSWKKNMDVLQPVKAFPASKRTNAICHSPPFSHALMAAQQVTSSAHWSLLLVFHWNQGISSPSKYIKTWADVFQSTERVDDSQYKHALNALIFFTTQIIRFSCQFSSRLQTCARVSASKSRNWAEGQAPSRDKVTSSCGWTEKATSLRNHANNIKQHKDAPDSYGCVCKWSKTHFFMFYLLNFTYRITCVCICIYINK